jgi:hypothetical protein
MFRRRETVPMSCFAYLRRVELRSHEVVDKKVITVEYAIYICTTLYRKGNIDVAERSVQIAIFAAANLRAVRWHSGGSAGTKNGIRAFHIQVLTG